MPRAISIDDTYIHISKDAKECSSEAAAKILSLIIKNPVRRISFATGAVMSGVYDQLVKQTQRDQVDWSDVECFQVAEYYPCLPSESFSFTKFLKENLVRPLFLSDARVHFLDATTDDAFSEVKRFDLLLHDLDLSILGIGPGGHLGLNEPGSSFDSRTRLVDLAPATIVRDHVQRGLQTPTQGLTQGMANILGVNQIFLIAMGESKADLIQHMFNQPISENFPATALRAVGKKVTLFLDEAAAVGLGR